MTDGIFQPTVRDTETLALTLTSSLWDEMIAIQHY